MTAAKNIKGNSFSNGAKDYLKKFTTTLNDFKGVVVLIAISSGIVAGLPLALSMSLIVPLAVSVSVLTCSSHSSRKNGKKFMAGFLTTAALATAGIGFSTVKSLEYAHSKIQEAQKISTQYNSSAQKYVLKSGNNLKASPKAVTPNRLG